MNSEAKVEVSNAVKAFLSRELSLFIDGASCPAHSSARLDVFDPSTGQTLTSVPDADAIDVDRAVANARQAFREGRWRSLRPAERERILLRFADVLEAHGEELAQLETLNQGKSINVSRMIDIGATLEYVRYMAGWATKITGETLDVSIPFPPGARFTAYTRKEPVGVVAGIVPWNFPLMIAVWKLIPALAAGCTIVIKPSPETPLTALRLAELAVEAGVPAGVFNVVTGGRDCGAALAAHPDVNKISFTGSTPTGKLIGAAAVQNVTRFSLELGGKNPAVMLADVDVDQAVQGVLAGGFLNQGQVCAAVSRIYVHRDKYRAIADGLADVANAMTVGPGLDPSAQVNPLVSAHHRALSDPDNRRRRSNSCDRQSVPIVQRNFKHLDRSEFDERCHRNPNVDRIAQRGARSRLHCLLCHFRHGWAVGLWSLMLKPTIDGLTISGQSSAQRFVAKHRQDRQSLTAVVFSPTLTAVSFSKDGLVAR